MRSFQEPHATRSTTSSQKFAGHNLMENLIIINSALPALVGIEFRRSRAAKREKCRRVGERWNFFLCCWEAWKRIYNHRVAGHVPINSGAPQYNGNYATGRTDEPSKLPATMELVWRRPLAALLGLVVPTDRKFYSQSFIVLSFRLTAMNLSCKGVPKIALNFARLDTQGRLHGSLNSH